MAAAIEQFLANIRSKAGRREIAKAQPRRDDDKLDSKIVRLDEFREQRRARESEREAAREADHGCELEALRGRLIELSASAGGATLTAAMDLVLEAQRASEPVAWIAIAGPDGGFYPPDAAASGVDFAALAIIRTPDVALAARSANRLLRGGGFGLIILELGRRELAMTAQNRLANLAKAHEAIVACLTAKPADAGALGSLVSLRAEVLRTRGTERAERGERGEIAMRVLKDKRRGPGARHVLARRALARPRPGGATHDE